MQFKLSGLPSPWVVDNKISEIQNESMSLTKINKLVYVNIFLFTGGFSTSRLTFLLFVT